LYLTKEGLPVQSWPSPLQIKRKGGKVNMEKMNIANLAKGALLERADVEIKRALENIADPNTDWKKSRKVTLTIDFKARDEGRDSISVGLQAKSSISPYNPVSTQIYIDKDDNGNIVAQEFVKGQMKDQIVIDGGTGEILSEEPETGRGRKVVGIKR
jgi:hypothetical protein